MAPHTDIASTSGHLPPALLTDPTRHTVSVPQAAALLGISRTAASRAYRRTGFITDGVPVMRIGKRCVVPTAALRKVLCIELEPATA